MVSFSFCKQLMYCFLFFCPRISERKIAHSHMQKMARNYTWHFISKLSASPRSLKFGLKTFSPNKDIPSRTAIRTIASCLPACGFWPILEVALFRLICGAWRKSKVRWKNGGARELQGFASMRKGGSKSRTSVCFLCESHENTKSPSRS